MITQAHPARSRRESPRLEPASLQRARAGRPLRDSDVRQHLDVDPLDPDASEPETRVERPSDTSSARDTPFGLEYLVEFAHDIRTPLDAVLALTYGLQAGVYGAPTEQQVERLTQLQDSARAIGRLVDDLVRLAESREPAAHHVEPFQVADVLRCVGALGIPLTEGTGLRLIVRNFAPGRYLGPGGAITRVLFNLVRSAVKLTDRGAVVFGARQTSADCVEFFVRDTASGDTTPPRGIRAVAAAPAHASTRTSRGEEDDLSLAICRRMLRSIGSRLEVDSRLGEGHAFRFAVTVPQVSD